MFRNSHPDLLFSRRLALKFYFLRNNIYIFSPGSY